ncbi:hypothetical protein NBRC111893_2572 [Lentilactobacillus kosonis]|uniref:Uncharacterized protein n=1 Tax=Lentilactobacillus kosonis TaxID=2810561 RepID=A0A401FQ20_9LACO|nr:hypothetical protein NBRC111893_2572 [Lentilactobacillus kosonis]
MRNLDLKFIVLFHFLLLFFHGTTIAINSYFQGIIATIYGFTLIVFFWNWLTADSKENVTN